MNVWFGRFARFMADICGRSYTFVIVCALIALWLGVGPWFHWSDTWQLWINTITTIITSILVFVIQHTQNKDTIAIQLKLDELIRVTAASDRMQRIEDLTEDELHYIKARRQTSSGG